MADHSSRPCPDCNEGLNRRQFVAAVGGAALLSGGFAALAPRRALAAPSASSPAEGAVKRLYDSLNDAQRKMVCLPWEDARRTKVNANWEITDATVSGFAKEQQALIHEIVKGVTSEDGYGRFLKQMESDHGGIGSYAIAIFGKPGDAKSSFALTGRHLTLRADGDTTENTAFGGPIVYGHGAKGNTDGNLFWYQTKRANEVFKALDEKQRKRALLARAPSEEMVQIREAGAELPGVPGSELSADQKGLVKSTLADIMAPYRKDDVDEVLALVEAGGGVDKLHMAFYQQGDLDDDGTWDVWRIEGPTLVCHFRGAPHVHAYINVAKKG